MSFNIKDSELFTASGCLTMEAMDRLLSSRLTESQKAKIKSHLDQCLLCSDAMEGLQLVMDKEKLNAIIAEINENLRKNLLLRKSVEQPVIRALFSRWTYIAAAASVLLLIAVFTYLNFNKPFEKTAISVVEPEMVKDQFSDEKPIKDAEKALHKNEQVQSKEPEQHSAKQAIIENENLQKSNYGSDEKTDKNMPAVEELKTRDTFLTETLAGKEISSDLVRQEKSSIKTLDIASTQPIEYYLGAVIIESENLRETVITNDSISNPSETLAMSEFNSEQKNTQESLNKTKDKSIRPKKKDKSVSAVSDSENKTLNQQPAEMLETNDEALIKKADKMPEFPGGTQGLILYLQEHLHYPSSDKLRGIQGNLYISFIIEENGKISSVEILKGLGGECDSEAVKAVSSMPDWQPGIVDGKPVRVRFTLPITFQLNK